MSHWIKSLECTFLISLSAPKSPTLLLILTIESMTTYLLCILRLSTLIYWSILLNIPTLNKYHILITLFDQRWFFLYLLWRRLNSRCHLDRWILLRVIIMPAILRLWNQFLKLTSSLRNNILIATLWFQWPSINLRFLINDCLTLSNKLQIILDLIAFYLWWCVFES